jgi:hypothetical protein
MSLASFAAMHGVVPGRLYRWRRSLKATGAKNDRVEFAEVAVERAVLGSRIDRERIEIVLEDGRVVRVGSDFDASVLRRLLVALGEAGRC